MGTLHCNDKTFVFNYLPTYSDVLVKTDSFRMALQPLFQGLYEVIKCEEKYFTLRTNNRENKDSMNRLNPCFTTRAITYQQFQVRKNIFIFFFGKKCIIVAIDFWWGRMIFRVCVKKTTKFFGMRIVLPCSNSIGFVWRCILNDERSFNKIIIILILTLIFLWKVTWKMKHYHISIYWCSEALSAMVAASDDAMEEPIVCLI